MTPLLMGKRARVTGAASGIGRATALELGRRGAAVALVDLSSCAELAEDGRRRAHHSDLVYVG